jgi:type II secretory pathway component GspD/PulD (secretin)
MGLLPKSKRDSFLDLLCSLSDAADAAPEQARAEIKAAKKAAKEAKKAEKAARKGDGKSDGRGKKKKKGATEAVSDQPQTDDAANAVVVPLKDAAEG